MKRSLLVAVFAISALASFCLQASIYSNTAFWKKSFNWSTCNKRSSKYTCKRANINDQSIFYFRVKKGKFKGHIFQKIRKSVNARKKTYLTCLVATKSTSFRVARSTRNVRSAAIFYIRKSGGHKWLYRVTRGQKAWRKCPKAAKGRLLLASRGGSLRVKIINNTQSPIAALGYHAGRNRPGHLHAYDDRGRRRIKTAWRVVSFKVNPCYLKQGRRTFRRSFAFAKRKGGRVVALVGVRGVAKFQIRSIGRTKKSLSSWLRSRCRI